MVRFGSTSPSRQSLPYDSILQADEVDRGGAQRRPQRKIIRDFEHSITKIIDISCQEYLSAPNSIHSLWSHYLDCSSHDFSSTSSNCFSYSSNDGFPQSSGSGANLAISCVRYHDAGIPANFSHFPTYALLVNES